MLLRPEDHGAAGGVRTEGVHAGVQRVPNRVQHHHRRALHRRTQPPRRESVGRPPVMDRPKLVLHLPRHLAPLQQQVPRAPRHRVHGPTEEEQATELPPHLPPLPAHLGVVDGLLRDQK